MESIKGDQLEKIEHFLSLGYFDSVVKECSAMLEEILKKVYKQALSELPIEDRSILLESEGKIGNKTKGYNRFGFGELVGLFNRSRWSGGANTPTAIWVSSAPSRWTTLWSCATA